MASVTFFLNRYTPVQIATPSLVCLLLLVAVALTGDVVASALTLVVAMGATVVLAFQPVNVSTPVGTIVRVVLGLLVLPTVTVIVVTMRRRIERQFAAAADAERRWFHEVLHSLQDPVVETDWQAITDANPAFLRMSGFEREELLGAKGPYPFFPADQIAAFAAALEAAMRGEAAEFQLTLQRKDGRRLPVLLSVSRMLNGSPARHRVLYTFRDISSLRPA
jgi:PAS domain S-box-containing protein